MRMHQTLLSDAAGRNAVIKAIGNTRVRIAERLFSGASLNSLRDRLRAMDYSMPNHDHEALELLQRMGFKTQEGFSGRLNRRRGITYYFHPAIVVINIGE